jgi:hypothetical protein
VNINVTDVLTNNQVNVQVPVGVAIALCDVNVALLAELGPDEAAPCPATTTQDLPVRFRP